MAVRFYPRESLKYVEILRSGRRLGDGEITFYKDMFFPIPFLLGKKTSVFSHGLFFPCLKYPRCSCAQGPFLLFCQFSLGDSVLFSGLSNCLNAHDPHVSLLSVRFVCLTAYWTGLCLCILQGHFHLSLFWAEAIICLVMLASCVPVSTKGTVFPWIVDLGHRPWLLFGFLDSYILGIVASKCRSDPSTLLCVHGDLSFSRTLLFLFLQACSFKLLSSESDVRCVFYVKAFKHSVVLRNKNKLDFLNRAYKVITTTYHFQLVFNFLFFFS